MRRKGRRLNPEEEKLWRRIADTATPLKDKPASLQPQKSKNETEPGKGRSFVPEFRIGERAPDPPRTETRFTLPDQPLRMDRKLFARMKRGKSTPDARLDLHGMTVDTAHSALNSFISRSHADGKRLVLVITGKGQHDSEFASYGRGILRRQVPHWLQQSPLRQLVLQVVPAHQRHGGEGALYVYLRK